MVRRIWNTYVKERNWTVRQGGVRIRGAFHCVLTKMGMKTYGIVTERWPWKLKSAVKMWLVENFGVNGDRWGEEYDYGLENLWMNEDVYTAYLLRWT